MRQKLPLDFNSEFKAMEFATKQLLSKRWYGALLVYKNA